MYNSELAGNFRVSSAEWETKKLIVKDIVKILKSPYPNGMWVARVWVVNGNDFSIKPKDKGQRVAKLRNRNKLNYNYEEISFENKFFK